MLFSDEIDNFDQTSNKIVDNGNQEDENDYDDAVEIVEEKQSEDDEDDNIAQHESESEDEQDLAAEDEKLSQIDNFNVRGKLSLHKQFGLNEINK